MPCKAFTGAWAVDLCSALHHDGGLHSVMGTQTSLDIDGRPISDVLGSWQLAFGIGIHIGIHIGIYAGIRLARMDPMTPMTPKTR
jgi:hypothetical protein